MELSVGMSLTEVTVTVNDRLKVALSAIVARSLSRPASSTVIVITAVPDLSDIGVNAIEPVTLADA